MEPQAKRPRVEEIEDQQMDHPREEEPQLAEELPPGLKLIYALQNYEQLDPIVYCFTKMDRLYESIKSYEVESDDNWSEYCDEADFDVADFDGADSNGIFTYGIPEDPEAMKKHVFNEKVMSKIADIHVQNCCDWACGKLEDPFRLRITRPGCEFDGLIEVSKKDTGSKASSKERNKEATSRRLEKWYENAAISGYGDVKSQTTKVDVNIRKAKEIPGSEFSIDLELQNRIANLWQENFFPKIPVRVEPYKIHLYGKDDHFLTHRDTPQQELVGTFLLGLGDTTGDKNLNVGGAKHEATQLSWVAFYPDTPHYVKPIQRGYRAVVAFKIFRFAGSQETPKSLSVRKEITGLVQTMQSPFGILLEQKYCLGTTEFTGFDSLLLSSCKELKEVTIHHLPIVLSTLAKWGNKWEHQRACSANVYAFTKGHIDVMYRFKDLSYRDHPTLNHSDCDAPWLEGVEHVPFYASDLSLSLHTYTHDTTETANYVGNEAEAWRTDGVYLSYAILVQPIRPVKFEGGESKSNESNV